MFIHYLGVFRAIEVSEKKTITASTSVEKKEGRNTQTVIPYF